MPNNKYNKYKTDFAKNNYERMFLQVKKGNKDFIIQSAKDLGYTSTNQFIIDAIMEKIARKQ